MSLWTEPISWENHVEWFAQKQKDPNCFHFMALADKPVSRIGQVRFDVRGNEAEIDISVDEIKRGLGYGTTIIELGIKEIFENTPVTIIHAYVKPENTISIRMFLKAGFYLELTSIFEKHLDSEYKAKHFRRIKE